MIPLTRAIADLAAAVQHMDMEVHHSFTVDGWAYLLLASLLGYVTCLLIHGRKT